jgi:LmbE family N-acetylglucosaminyl deacetylase
MSKKRILSVAAHGDDAEFFAGGTMARLVNEGYDLYLAIATNNERGSFRLSMPELRQIARPEAEASLQALGGCEVFMLGYTDGDLCDETKTVLRGKVMRLIRKIQPDIVFSWDPFAPYETHPDHRAIAWATSDAVSFSHFPLFHPEHFEDGLKPHRVGEKYWYSKAEWETNLIVDTTETIETKLNALYGYHCQMVLTIDDVLHEARSAGVPEAKINLIDPYEFKPLIARGIKNKDARMGAKIGVAYGEAFRHEKDEIPELFQ